MDVRALAQLFHAGKVLSSEGPIVAERAFLTRKSLLVMTKQSVLKLRRPRLVDGFDQELLSVRYGMTARERWLGRQLAPEVYLPDCVLRVTWDEAEGSEGEPRVVLLPGLVEGEPVVAMRRLPSWCRADERLAEGTLTVGAMTPLVERLVTFQAAAPVHQRPPFGAAQRPAERWRSWVDELAAVPIAELWPSEGRRAAFLDETEELFEAAERTLAHRVMEGRVRETHGELALEHIFLDTDFGAVLVDPEDGADGDRTMDVGEEIMRLSIELELAGGRELADGVVETWASATRDTTLRRVAPLFRRLALLRLAVLGVRSALDSEPEPEGLERARFALGVALEG